MRDFEPISLSHRDRALEYLCCKKAIHTEGSFNALYAWGVIYNTSLCFRDGFLFIRSGSGKKIYYQVPRGDGDIAHALGLIREEDLPAVRVDLYSIRGKMYFGEMTFFPWSGYMRFKPDGFDKALGDLFIFPDRNC